MGKIAMSAASASCHNNSIRFGNVSFPNAHLIAISQKEATLRILIRDRLGQASVAAALSVFY